MSSGISPLIAIDRDGPVALHQQIYDTHATALR